MLNPGNTRTFTLTERQTALLMQAVEDQIESLEENAQARDLHTNAEIGSFEAEVDDLRLILSVLDSSD